MVRAGGPAPGRRRAVTPPDESSVRLVGGPAGGGLPIEVRPDRGGVELAEYVLAHAATVESWRHRAGAVLFRGFGVTLQSFGAVTRALAGEPESYRERSSPRTVLGDRVYTATDQPAHQSIALHNENSYQRDFPGAMVFCCLVPAEQGGATPLADTRRVLDRIPADVLAPFVEYGVMYVRNFGGGLGLPWPEVFQTTSRQAVMDYCAVRDIAVEWKPDGGLRTRHVRPAVARHPVTGERVWFNHAVFFNVYGLDPTVRDALRGQVGDDGLPNNTYYGDGRPIPAEVVQTLAAAYRAEEVAAPWETGDVLLVDNLLAAHGRQPFTGARSVAVSMAAPITWDEVDPRRTNAIPNVTAEERR